ncbi:SDR family oxidoreductase [Ramlibacter tataouinensis]|uniref:SDR family oxidoreductase n=1 Tax=Ramlibacter tataouinensis TaxID=94132 RepID=UPI0022F397E5|nr:SDR family oxidoreductase [Ramlibacter tataouinensis]WBY01125.1 SDR family oxidoreductase [Ramlibacter tataouinensis]
MRILLTGATGLIGGAIARALLRQGHQLVCAVRDPARLQLGAGASALQADLAGVPTADWWAAHLRGVDAVVNAVGILRESPGQSFEALHHRAPAELFRACGQAGVACVVQVSALGADRQARSRYHLSKRAADDVLRSLPLRGAIVQPSLVFAPGGASSSLFLELATAPVLALPQRGAMPVQPVHLDDVVEGVLALLAQPPPRIETLAFAGPQPLPLRDYLASLRGQLGLGRGPWVLPLPAPLFLAGACIAAHLPGSFLDGETAGMLLRGNAAPAERFARLLGHSPRAPASFIDPSRAGGLRAQAVLGWARPLLRLTLAAMWIWTAAVSLGLYPVELSYGLLARVGLHGGLAALALYGAAALDLLLGVLTLGCPPRWRRWLWPAQLALIGGYTVLVTLFLPEYWLHPYGPISKNLPIMAAIALLWGLEPGRR